MILADTMISLDLATAAGTATVIMGGLTTIATVITKIFTGYLRERDVSWQETIKSQAAITATAQADNRALLSATLDLVRENSQTMLQFLREPK